MGPTTGWEAACGLQVSDLWGFSPARSAGSHLPDSQTEIWLLVVINILRRGQNMWLRKELKKKITFYSLSYPQLLSQGDSGCPSFLWEVDIKIWHSGLPGWAGDSSQRLFCLTFQKDWFILRYRLDGDISLLFYFIFINLFIFQDRIEQPFVWVERHLIWTDTCLYLSIWEERPLWNLKWELRLVSTAI